MFQRFSQVNANALSQYGGSGLGLAISDKLVKLMQSKIVVESKKDEGSRFSFVLECEASTPEVLPVATSPANAESPLFTVNQISAKKILLVDDNSINLKILTRLLENLGYKNICTANNGKDAVEYFTEKGPFDLIFMDMEMPVMSGDEAARQIRQKEQVCSLIPTPIISLTGHTEEKYQQQALAAGMNDVLTKPAKKERIQQILETWLASLPATKSANQDTASADLIDKHQGATPHIFL